jgi:hypothetical protein
VRPDPRPTRYIDTGLHLYSRADLADLVTGLEESGVAFLGQQPEGRWYFQTYRRYKTPAESVDKILLAVESLDPQSATLFRRCRRRTLDIGFEADEGTVVHSLKPALLARVAELGFELHFTVYGAKKSGGVVEAS